MTLPFPRSLSVVVPCFNEAGILKRYASELFPELDKLRVKWDVLFVDDGSTDATNAGLRALVAQDSRLRLLTHEKNLGLGRALRTAFEACTAEAVVTIDADLTFHPREIAALLKGYRPELAAVIGSPFLGRLEGVHPFRKFLSASVNAIYQRLLGTRLTSFSGIFRLYRTDVVAGLTLRSESFDINAEILMELLFRGFLVSEVPVSLTRRDVGESKIRTSREIGNHLRLFGKILRRRWLS